MEETVKKPLLLIKSRPESKLRGLPSDNENIYNKIITHPYKDAKNAKETLCTGMLCGLLANTEKVRNTILKYMLERNGYGSEVDFDLHKFTFETERHVPYERGDIYGLIDLVITGKLDKDSDVINLLWIIEAKVGAQVGKRYIEEEDQEGKIVKLVTTQLGIYQDWYNKQKNDNSGMFLLAMKNIKKSLSDKYEKWNMITWTGICEAVEKYCFENEDEISEKEMFLAKHFVGFVKQNLWSDTEMTDMRLDFDDVAFIRAFADFRNNSGAKIKRFMEEISIQLNESDEFKDIFVSRNMTPTGDFMKSSYSYCSGIINKLGIRFYTGFFVNHAEWTDDRIGFFIGIDCDKEVLERVTELITSRENHFSAGWTIHNNSADSTLHKYLSFEEILVSENQPSKICEFIKIALCELKESGIIDAIKAL